MSSVDARRILEVASLVSVLADDLERRQTSLTRDLQALAWHGPARDRFVLGPAAGVARCGAFQAEALRTLANRLRALAIDAQRAHERARQLDDLLAAGLRAVR